jgi:hypothetical protein
MLALYRSGRHPEALAAYRDACQALDEIGLQPGPELRQLEQAILRHDESLSPTVSARPVPTRIGSNSTSHSSAAQVGASPSELREHEGTSFFVYSEPGGKQRVVCIGPERRELTIGRSQATDLSIEWDNQVSALHAVIESLAGELTLADDGLSRNGSYVNGERVRGRRRLRDGDMLRLGRTEVLVRNPTDAKRRATSAALHALTATEVSYDQRNVLNALCRQVKGEDDVVALPTNQEIGDELHMPCAAVALQLRALFDKFGIAKLPPNQQRVALATLAFRSGLVGESDMNPNPRQG